MIGSVNLNLSLNYFRENVFQKQDNENLNSLLNFCLNFLYNRQELDFWSFKSIENFNKTDLFNRLCDEVFLAIYKLRDAGLLHTHYEFILDDFLAIDKKRIELRDLELKNKTKIPNFNKTLQFYGQ